MSGDTGERELSDEMRSGSGRWQNKTQNTTEEHTSKKDGDVSKGEERGVGWDGMVWEEGDDVTVVCYVRRVHVSRYQETESTQPRVPRRRPLEKHQQR